MEKNIIYLTESELKEIIVDAVKQVINEGIDIQYKNGKDIVKMTDSHEKMVDTSVANNPTVLTDFIPNITVWSIFKRKDDEWGDGNPLLYSLKKENNYVLANPKQVEKRIKEIVHKFFENNSNIDITIAVPSKNKLNQFFAHVVSSYCKNPKYINNVLVKMSTEEVYEHVKKESSAFCRYYKKQSQQKLQILKHYFSKMKNNTFQFHKVADMEMRKVIEHTIKLSDKFYGDYIDAINDKNVLIIDDSLTLGQTIKESCQIIADAYTPKSISVLTLFSPLYCEGGDELKK